MTDKGSIPGSGRSPGKGHSKPFQNSWASLAQMVENLPAMWETWVRSLGWEDPLEKGMAIHHACLENPKIPQILPGQRSQVGYSSWGCKELDMAKLLSA